MQTTIRACALVLLAMSMSSCGILPSRSGGLLPSAPGHLMVTPPPPILLLADPMKPAADISSALENLADNAEQCNGFRSDLIEWQGWAKRSGLVK